MGVEDAGFGSRRERATRRRSSGGAWPSSLSSSRGDKAAALPSSRRYGRRCGGCRRGSRRRWGWRAAADIRAGSRRRLRLDPVARARRPRARRRSGSKRMSQRMFLRPRRLPSRSAPTLSAIAVNLSAQGPHMKFFVDTADTAEIRDLAETGLLDGVTTNPVAGPQGGPRLPRGGARRFAGSSPGRSRPRWSRSTMRG